MANKVGRPSEYKEEYINEVDDYLKETTDEWIVKGKQGNTTVKQGLTVDLPTIEGFALRLDVNKVSLYRWEKEHEEFSNALDKIRTEQQKRLLNMGLSGDYNPTIAKLILSSNHGMSEKTETDITSNGKELGIIMYPTKDEDTLETTT